MGSVSDHATHTFELDFGHEKQTFYSATVICMYAFVYEYVPMHIYVRMYVCMYACIFVYVCMCIGLYVCIRE